MTDYIWWLCLSQICLVCNCLSKPPRELDTKDAAFTDGNEDKASPELKYGTSFAAEGVDQSAIEVDYTEICFTPGVETSDLQIYTWDIH